MNSIASIIGLGASINERVRSLVFIAALTPDEGETVGEVFYREKPHPEGPQLVPDTHGFLWMPDDRFGTTFCQHASSEQAALLAATQRPIALACIQEKAPGPAWKAKSSWYLVAEEDGMINPATQLFLARRMGAQIRSEEVDHAPMVTARELVIEIILQTVTNLAARPNTWRRGKRQRSFANFINRAKPTGVFQLLARRQRQLPSAFSIPPYNSRGRQVRPVATVNHQV
jgi:hypothetical protein